MGLTYVNPSTWLFYEPTNSLVMQIRIGNLNVMSTQKQLAELFFPFGKVTSSKIERSDPEGHSGRIGFIEMNKSCGNAAIRKLHLLLFMNAYIEVDEVVC